MYELKDKELIFVFTGPNGAGRRTVADMAGLTLNIKQVLSYTTRTKRPTETEGEDYFFVSREDFQKAQHLGQFIEVIEFAGKSYGIKNIDIESQLQASGCIYLILNREGANILKKLYGDKVIRIFIYADRDELIARQQDRGDSPEQITRYLDNYEKEYANREECEHLYDNSDLSHTMYDITKTLESYLDRTLQELD
jgi:guanylate kinase